MASSDSSHTSPEAEGKTGPRDGYTENPYDKAEESIYEPIRADGHYQPERTMSRTSGGMMRRNTSQSELFESLSRRQTQASQTNHEEMEEINRLLTQMFGSGRKQSADEKTRHLGVVFKNLTVKGKGLGATLQTDLASPFFGIKSLFQRGPKGAASRPPIRTLISDFSGVIRPGELVLVLGKPGSGCSTFLKCIANQRFGYENVSGEVTYGGTSAGEMAKKYRGEILYNPEDDLHYATLSVKDTLNFALKTRTPGKDSRNEGETREEYNAKFFKVLLKLFWIEHTANTKVGDEHIRGVSGGEKKRVSIAEAMITRASTQCWDNSTRGLDASTAREYVESLRALTDMANISTAAALYQVGESLWKLFDKVILIDEGECVYYGPTDQAERYFTDLGFNKPDRWTTADFLVSVTDPHERKIKQGYEDRIPRSAKQFGDIFRKSEMAKQNLEEIAAFEKETEHTVQQRDANATKSTKKKNYAIPFHKQIAACTTRQAKVMLGDPQALIGKWGAILFQSLIVGSLFYNLPATSAGVFPRGGVLFFMLLFNSLLALAELTSAFSSRPILLKHKSFSFYRPAAYAIAQTVIDGPLVFIQVFIFDVVVYFMAHLSRTASQFFISLLFLWILTMTMYALFRAVGALFGSLDGATKVTGIIIQILVVYTGYLIPPAKMHPWFSWLRWINPVQYGFESLMANEFYNLQIQCVPPSLVPQGPLATSQYQSCTIQGSQPGQTIVQGSDYIEVAYEYSRSHLWRNLGIVIAFFLFFVTVTAVGLEIQKPNKGGGALTIFKRGQVGGEMKKAMEDPTKASDEESGEVTPVALKDEAGSTSEDELSSKGLLKNETVFTWTDVNYVIPYEKGTRQLLRDQQGYVRPGRLTALMGASGAGKTTLLNVLAQRVRFGTITGNFLVDGRPLPKSFQRSSGFAEQMDLHEPTQTVREALQFSAKLRQPREVSLEEKYAYVEDVIQLLEMDSIAGAVIGIPGAGLNQEQRKRLTIGVELASKPELLMFLDEPTSGLDSAAAFNIVRLLKKLSGAGQAILCTIHQPSSVLFENFDELLLLQAGGRIVYHGELGADSKTLIEYIERNGTKKCPPKANAAEFMLEAIGAGNPDYDGPNFGDVWAASPEHDARNKEIQELNEKRRQAEMSSVLRDQREFAMPFGSQLSTVIHRTFLSYWRSPDYVTGKFMLHVVTGLFNSFTFWRLGNSSIDMQSRLFSVFMTLTISPPLIQQLQPKFINFRDLYKGREANSKIYDWKAFAVAAQLVEIPYSLAAGTIYWCCWYWGIGFPHDTYTAASTWLMIMSFELFYVSFGQAIASFAPSELLASILVPVFFTFVVAFCGIVVPYAGLPTFWRSWMYWLTPFHYLLEAILGPLIHNIPVQCARSELAIFSPPSGLSCEDYVGPYVAQAGGSVTTLTTSITGERGNVGDCGFCQYANGDQFGASFNVYNANQWRDYGIFWAYIIFNICIVFFCSWLMLVGGRKIKTGLGSRKKKFSGAKREEHTEEKKAGEV